MQQKGWHKQGIGATRSAAPPAEAQGSCTAMRPLELLDTAAAMAARPVVLLLTGTSAGPVATMEPAVLSPLT